MRILQLGKPIIALSPDMKYGGIERVIRDLDMAYTRSGHESIVVAPEDSDMAGTLFPSVPSALWQPKEDGTYTIDADPSMEAFHLEKTREAIETLEPDVIQDHIGFIATQTFQETDTRGVPILHTLHGPVNCLPTDRQSNLVKRILGDPSVFTAAISKRQAEAWARLVDADFMIYNGIDPENYPFEADKRNYLLSLGSIHPEKRTHIAIEAARKTGDNMIVAGPVHTFREKIRRYLEKEVFPKIDETHTGILPDQIDKFTADLANKRGRIIYVGEVNDAQKVKWFGHAKTFAMPIDWDEAFGLVIIEAMSTGTPVVSFAVGASPEIIEHGRTGYLAPRGDFESFTNYLTRGHEIDPLNARERVERHFSLERQAKEYISAFEQMLEMSQ